MNPTIKLILDELAIFAKNPLFAGLTPVVGEILGAVSALWHVVDAADPQLQSLLLRVKNWNAAHSGPTTQELQVLAAERAKQDALAKTNLSALEAGNEPPPPPPDTPDPETPPAGATS